MYKSYLRIGHDVFSTSVVPIGALGFAVGAVTSYDNFRKEPSILNTLSGAIGGASFGIIGLGVGCYCVPAIIPLGLAIFPVHMYHRYRFKTHTDLK
jgi:hypothetical protein